MQTKSFSMKMSDGFEIALNRWMPDSDTEIKGIIQLHHGLAEHSMRYDRFGSVLADAGYVLNAYDMRGHGLTAENSIKNGTGLFGKLADKNGFNRAIEDLHEIINSFKDEYKGKKVILFGHSFGSLISQGFIEKYGSEIDGCVLCGTSGPQGALPFFGHIAVKLVRLFRGGDSIVNALDKLTFGNYNDKVEVRKGEHDWLSTNEMNIQLYEMDNWCGFKLRTSFYDDLTGGLMQIHKASNIKKIPVSLPVFFIYGSDDPVGNYGKNINVLYNMYKKNGMTKVDLKAYEGDRHEILNENDRETVENDVIDWISKI